ncbi:helix-turn-helix transcriptional regulator [cf. Phormidesmis sp. LEGE 11477]|uniref:helix-turn-helix domain-containing protein n=1 Tax=cf. Phormidesmis sp. LEGE 11477 TaxID=1828680 RepID=UPI00187DF0D1|nr:helix-turn-helix transcriptional regulator [cf. Phormidesmis sp. LEGE 11477]MBE9060516.1 helix-turn-helix transcriptional regulator [cf. Phormidesmis sp. LEGE 11477]
MPSDSTQISQILRELMQAAGITSYRLLAERAGVSRWQIQQLKNGHIQKMRLASLMQISAALKIDFTDLCAHFESGQLQKYSREHQENHHKSNLETTAADTLQETALQTLESWLIQWPTIVKRAQDRPDLPATKILPFVRPVEQLMAEWGVEPIATVDCQVEYDPTYHQLVAGSAKPGDCVRVTHTGIIHHGKLLHRAKVKPITGDS